MSKLDQIKLLPPDLASQIAAGEVVERPASVVKELIENALDAGGKSIEIEVSLRKRRIRVKDDGAGIAPGEIELALSHHGTSKIASINDISGIKSYGFRGEALPSIASVSKFTLSSYRKGEKRGRTIFIEGGKTIGVEEAPPVEGTEALVENLFYNTPARRKFVRKEATEMTHITARVIQAALCAQDVRFVFIKDGKRVLELPPAGSLVSRVGQIFGAEYAENLVEIDYSDFNIKVEGLAGKPDFNRASGIDQYFFVNSRPVKDAVIRMATARAFEGLIPKGRKAVVFLRLTLPYESIDVNVHPAKAEVRFADPGAVSGAIVSAVHKALGRYAATPLPGAKSFSQDRTHFTPAFTPGKNDRSFARTFELWRPPAQSASPGEADALDAALLQPALASAHGHLGESAVAIGQLFATFIVFEEKETMILMDQHTVHERILYERLMKRYSASGIERQSLIAAETFETDPKRSQLVRNHLKTFEKLGWDIEEFGKDSFAIRSVPAMLVGGDYSRIVNDIISSIDENRDQEFTDLISACITMMACRSAVKSGDVLGREEIMSMAGELAKVELPYTCPHGRPIAYTLSRDVLNRYFGRPSRVKEAKKGAA